MSRIAVLTFIVVGLWVASHITFVLHTTANVQLLSMLFFVVLVMFTFVCIARIFVRWRRDRYWTLAPPLICIVSVPLAMALGRPIAHRAFERELPHYEAVIRKINSGEIPVSVEGSEIREAEDAHTYGVFAQRRTDGVLQVEFVSGAGLPAKHSGYMYCSSGVPKPSGALHSWPIVHEVRPNWFHVSN